jgi:ATP phosphoribosyltransferase regulatory subunit
MEFEDTLLSGAGRAVARESFRLMDPVSQRMMALRADMTPQVARIAATRLASAPRPLRLCYGGQVLRVRGGQLRPERQFAQAGAELIGAPQVAGDAEVVVLATSPLEAAGVRDLTVDLSLPPLVSAITDGLGHDRAAATALRQALDRKDSAAVAALAGTDAALFQALLRAAGPVAEAVPALQALDLPEASEGEIRGLTEVLALIEASAPALRVTVDPVEHRGFEYHIGVSFTLFARGVRGELGRGGRYRTGTGGSPATGVTLFMDSVLRALPPPATPDRLYLPFGTARGDADRWRGDGWVTVAGLAPAADAAAEARRLGCSHVLADGAVRPV